MTAEAAPLTPADAIATFTAATAADVLSRALKAAGFAAVGELQLLQAPSDNAVIHVPALGLVARIAAAVAHRDRLGRELAAADWLNRHELPATRPAARPPTPQLTVVDGRVLSWWEHLPSTTAAGYADHGRLLAQLHALPAPTFLPRLDPWSRLPHQIALAAHALPAADIDRLRRERARLAKAWTASPWTRAPAAPLHGDPYIGNTLTVDGQAHLLDFEDMAVGPPAWDVASVLGAHRLGWIDAGNWEAFCSGYGADLSNDPGMDFLVDVLAFRRCCWFASRAGRDPGVVDAARHRIATLHVPLAERRW